ncbi:hypothetical protein ACFQY7_21145 [Actinomadura luteofluorescens]|uniref:hypothetical protein n=1 Tax=Actinomadura luteofluorescens TaxID=46163 RepID=UPI00363C8D3C
MPSATVTASSHPPAPGRTASPPSACAHASRRVSRRTSSSGTSALRGHGGGPWQSTSSTVPCAGGANRARTSPGSDASVSAASSNTGSGGALGVADARTPAVSTSRPAASR